MDFEDLDIESDEDWSKPVNEDDGSFCSNNRLSPKMADSNLPKKTSVEIEHPKTIIHIDMDCFYAQVEMIRNPSLRHVPLGIQQKYIIVTCNYPARALGVTKLMTVKDAKSKCPSLRMVCGEDLTEYRKMSYKISEYLLKYTKKVERLGFDENFLDVSELVNSRVNTKCTDQFRGFVFGVEDNKPSPSGLKQCSCGCYRRIMIASNIAQDIRDGLYRDLGITCCAGISYNKVLAKLVGEKHKPNQQTTLLPQYTLELLHSLPSTRNIPDIRDGLYRDLGITCCAGISYNKVLAKLVGEKHKPNQQTTLLPQYTLELLHSLPSTRNIPGIGHGMAKRLATMGIDTVLDLYNYDKDKFINEVGQQTAKFLKDLSAGIDNTPVVKYGLPQSISDEDSYRDLNNIKDIEKQIDILVGNVLKRVEEDGRSPQTLRVTVRKSILKEGSLEMDYGNRESRQCPLSQTIFHNKDTGTWKKPIVELAIGLFNKMVDITKPIHLTLINICLTKFLKTSSHDISTFFSSPNSKPTPTQDDDFFTQKSSTSKISPAKGIKSFFDSNQTPLVQKDKLSNNFEDKQNGLSNFFRITGKRKECENDNVDSKRFKMAESNSSDLLIPQSSDSSKLQDLDIDFDVYDQLPPDIQNEILHAHKVSKTTPKPSVEKVTVIKDNVVNLDTKSKSKVGIASFFNKSPSSKILTASITKSSQKKSVTSGHSESLSKSEQYSSCDVPEMKPKVLCATAAKPSSASLSSLHSTIQNISSSSLSSQHSTVQIKSSSSSLSSKHSTVQIKSSSSSLSSKHSTVQIKSSSSLSSQHSTVQNKSSSSSSPHSSVQNKSLPGNDQLQTNNLSIPPNIDHSVFVTLPPEIQNELITEWKSSKDFNIVSSKKSKANTNILKYFNKR